MKVPESLETLVDHGIIQEVLRPLMSGKEAQVYLVVASGEECVAKVYKEAHQRSFKHRSNYTEGRRTRNTRDQRAMSKRSQHGRKKDEDAWRTTEVDMIYRLRDAGVRVPEPINFVDGVLVMELVKDAEGHPAPRLGDLSFSPSEAHEIYQKLIREVVRMLCAGVIHGDLSDFNVLMSPEGTVIIDFPQSVDPTHNPNGQKLLLRDVENLNRFLARFAPDRPARPYAQEIWSLYQANRLNPESKLSGLYQAPKGTTDTKEVMALIEDAHRDERMRRGGRRSEDEEEFEDSGMAPAPRPTPFRTVVDFSQEKAPRPAARTRDGDPRRTRRSRARRPASDKPKPPAGPRADSVEKNERPPTGPRRRRGGRSRSAPAREGQERAPRDEATSDDAARATDSTGRPRRRRGRPRGPAKANAKPNTQARPEGTKARTRSNEESGGRASKTAAGKASAPGGARRAGNPAPASSRARTTDDAAGTGRPARRRRRRPRNTSPSE